MSSHKSTRAAVPARRARGHARVAAIEAAANALFAERGFDGVTMTEVAERSGTAIGSLYRFFPSKDALAEHVLERFEALVGERFAPLADVAGGMAASAVASALVEMAVAKPLEHRAAITILDARGDGQARRAPIRARTRAGLGAILAARGTAADVLAARTELLLQLFKLGPVLPEDVRGEYRRLLELFLAQ